ncbi:CDP-alcohol phosphatidyltransferase family protein [Chelatococcus composti]|jgi:phosphatidylglycerophosphate synthase|uniref:Phosphatidylglycerophosphate synthase n=1 Tax=Chelatococcus composti TaxID=1743235 RepID=A0A841KAK0_9HYPH|nr:CDP-alcohol phosphatidyltransferase family protein [Chelatococcus composti]MBB6169130.1 phosphatidylglycerophosphate synthase [Chelatococcus composti]MBS7735988.1 CDP-alcohol phosphatidyltransferase family protein [Chelatococcus composti]GGG45366.1 phosphatidylglycerophosphate synthase [Chelatococcus composti]
MLDGIMRRVIDPPLAVAGRRLAAAGVSADAVTLAGFAAGLGGAAAVVLRLDLLAAVLFLAGRFADGLDGAIARARGRTDRGGFLDIVCDFAFYGAFPLAFALREPQANALAAAVLLFSFYANGATFLAYAAVAARRGWESRARGVKSIYFTAGLAEGTETILAFLLMLTLPQHFPPIAYVFAAMTLATALGRALAGWQRFREAPHGAEPGFSTSRADRRAE